MASGFSAKSVKVQIKLEGALGFEATYTMLGKDWKKIDGIFAKAYDTGYDQTVAALQDAQITYW